MVVKLYTLDEAAQFLADTFGDYCACNYNGNDEWLPQKCKFGETDCPSPPYEKRRDDCPLKPVEDKEGE